MEHVKALSIDFNFYEMVQLSNLPISIHSVFARTINIVVGNQLYTIAINELDNAPATLVVDLVGFEKFNFTVDDTVILVNSKIKISNIMSIDLNSASIWKSSLPHYPINDEQLKSNLQFSKKFIIKKGKADWLRGINPNQTLFYNEMGRMLRERTSNLMFSFLYEDLTVNIENAMKLVGLGQGLTPSGDDFLVGIMLAFSTIENEMLHKEKWASQVVKESEKKTNVISYSALKYAEIGETRESIALLIQALFTQKTEVVEQELLNVMTIGSSSGTEITWGIISGLLLTLK